MPLDHDLFSTALIRSYVDDPHFVERSWLASAVEAELATRDCRFLLLNAEPGAGKTALVAWLASQHADWPRYFIRKNSQEPLNSGNDRSFLLAVGHQLAAIRPELYQPERLALVVRQRVGEVQAGGSVVGITIQDLYVSPFYQTAQRIELDQQASAVGGRVEGVRIERTVTNERLLERGNLQYLALLDPALALAREDPNARIVVLVDAIDELRDTVGQATILTWLAECPELPPNVRIVLTTRQGYDAQLAEFRQKQRRWLREITIDPRSDTVQADVRRYAERLAAEDAPRALLAELWRTSDAFVSEVARKADGNFQYVAALSRAISEAAGTGDRERLVGLLSLEGLPPDLAALYAFFLTKIRARVTSEVVEIRGGSVYAARGYLPAWEGLYQPILGTLAVAREPLTAAQLERFVEAPIAESFLLETLRRLGQFLDEDHGAYRLYHNSFSEFLTAPATKGLYPECFIDPIEAHRRIVIFYRGDAASWGDVRWGAVDDYGLRHLTDHLYVLSATAGFERELFALIGPAFMRQKRLHFGSHRSFARDVSLLIALARRSTPSDLVQLARGGVLRATLGSLATHVPPLVVGLLAATRGLDAARDAALLIQDPEQRMAAHLRVVRALVDQNQQKEARLDSALAIAAAAERVWIALGRHELTNNQLAEMHVELARVLGEAGTLDLLIERYSNNRNMLSILAELLSRTSAHNAAITLARGAMAASEVTQSSSHVDTLCWAAQALAQAGQHEEAVEIAERALALGEQQGDATTPAWVVPALAAAERYDRALALAGAIPDSDARATAQHQIVRALVKAGALNRALTLSDTIESVETHADALAAVAAGFAAADSPREALALLARITYAAPYADALRAVVHAHASAGRWDEALATVERIDAAAALEQRWRQIVLPDTPKDVDILVNKVVLLNGVALWMARKGEAERATQLVTQAIQLMPEQAEPTKWSGALESAARALIEAGALQFAGAVTRSIVDEDRLTALLPEITAALARRGAVDKALELARAIPAVRPQAVGLASLACVLTEAGEVERAAAIADGAPQGLWRTVALGAVADALLRQGNRDLDAARTLVDRAARAADVLDDRGPAIGALCAIGELLLQRKARERALAVATWAEAQRPKLIFTKPFVEATTAVAVLFERAAERQQSTTVINEVFKVPIDPEIQVTTLLSMAEARGKGTEVGTDVQLVGAAMQTLRKIDDRHARDKAFAETITAMARAGSGAAGPATAMVSQVSNRLHRAIAICGIAQGLARAGDLEQARHLATIAMGLANDDFGMWQFEGQQFHILPSSVTAMGREHSEADQQRVNALALLARTLALVNNGEQAGLVSERAIGVASHISVRELKASSLCTGAETSATVGRAELARTAIANAAIAAREVEDRELRALALAGVAGTLHRLGRQDESLATLIDAFDTLLDAPRYGRAAIFTLLRQASPLIDAIDGGELLWATAQAVMDVEEWWE